jgi:F-type H+-transporting ATPase subunit delta
VSAPRIVARYAEAFFGLAQQNSLIEQLRGELEALAALVEQTPALEQLLARADLALEQKLEALRAALGESFSGAVMRLLAVLLEHARGEAVKQVAEAFGELADRAAGLVRAEACTVMPLTDLQRGRLTAVLQRMTGHPVKLTERLDPSVLAGIRLQVGDRLLDGSAAGRLATMREQLIKERG